MRLRLLLIGLPGWLSGDCDFNPKPPDPFWSVALRSDGWIPDGRRIVLARYVPAWHLLTLYPMSVVRHLVQRRTCTEGYLADTLKSPGIACDKGKHTHTPVTQEDPRSIIWH